MSDVTDYVDAIEADLKKEPGVFQGMAIMARDGLMAWGAGVSDWAPSVDSEGG